MDIILGAINNLNSCEMVARMVAFPEKARAGAPIFSCDNSSVSAMCTGRTECSSQTEVQFMYWTLCRVWFRTLTWSEPFVLMAVSHPLSGWLSLPSHEAKSTKERLRTGDMAGQTGPGKSKGRRTRNLFTQRESGKLATPQIWQIRLMSALLCAKISRELACRGNRAHTNMHTVQTCACNGWWQAGYQFLTSLSGAKSLIKILAHSRQITFIIWQDSVHWERNQHYFGIKKKTEWGNSSRLNAILFQLVFPAQWVIFTGIYWHKTE